MELPTKNTWNFPPNEVDWCLLVHLLDLPGCRLCRTSLRFDDWNSQWNSRFETKSCYESRASRSAQWLVVVFPLVWVVQHFVSFGDFLSGSSRVNSRYVPRQNLWLHTPGIDGHVLPRAFTYRTVALWVWTCIVLLFNLFIYVVLDSFMNHGSICSFVYSFILTNLSL